MSKVKIQGDASGTGIFTVAAPATNTDRTITLPDVDATVMTTAGGTISGVTQISNPTETGFASNLAETVSKATLKIKTHSTDSTLTTFGAISGGDAYIQRSNGPGTGSYNLRLNPFGGAVAMPSQPAFHAYPGSTVSVSSGNNKFIFNSTRFNIGNHYSTSTGRFTAPVTGVYLFTFQAYYYPGTTSDNYQGINLYVNGGNVYAGYARGGYGDTTWGNSIHLRMNANDYLEFFTYPQSSNNLNTSGSYLTGHLVG
jgi:hypothetical protein